MESLIKTYAKYRWFFTRSGTLVVGGKTAVQNDELLQRITSLREPLIVMHTAAPGSPFCVLLAESRTVMKAERAECAIFTGCFSRAWREKKKETRVDVFLSTQLYKDAGMKAGTWGVRACKEQFNVRLKLALVRQNGVLRAVPPASALKKDIVAYVCPGTLEKHELIPKLELECTTTFSQEELLAALPPGGSMLCTR